MRLSIATALVCGSVIAGCGSEAIDEPVPLPRSGVAYRALSGDERLTVAAGCRDRAAAAARGVAADEIKSIDPRVLREQLDAAFRLVRAQRRPVAAVCAERLPFVTPGLRLSFAGARDSGDAFTYETESDEPLTIRGAVSPPPRSGVVVARREFGPSRTYTSQIGGDGRFVLPTIRLRKLANNSFVLTIDAPPNALRKVYFSAICLDCLAGAPPSSGQR